MADESSFESETDEPQVRRRAGEPDEAEKAVRELVEMDPAAFLTLAGSPVTGPVRVIEAGVFPSILPIDRVLRVSDSKPWVAVVVLAASHDPGLVASLEVTFATLLVALSPSVPLDPMIVLVRPEADDPSIDGEVVRYGPWGGVNFSLRYRAIRAWQHPPGSPLGDSTSPEPDALARSGLPDLVAELRDRATDREEAGVSESVVCLVFALPDPEQVDQELAAFADELEQAAPCVLLSLDKRDDPHVASMQEGCAVMRWKVLRQGTRKFGAPDERIAQQVGSIASPRRLTDLDNFLARIDSRGLPIKSWEALLAWPSPAS